MGSTPKKLIVKKVWVKLKHIFSLRSIASSIKIKIKIIMQPH